MSEDGINWKTETDSISYPQMSAKQLGIKNDNFFYLLSGVPSRFVLINLSDKNSCLFQNPKVEIWGLDKATD